MGLYDQKMFFNLSYNFNYGKPFRCAGLMSPHSKMGEIADQNGRICKVNWAKLVCNMG